MGIYRGTAQGETFTMRSPGVADEIYGEDGFDDIFYDEEGGSSGIDVNFQTGVIIDTGGGRDTVTSIEGIGATDSADSIVGSDRDEIFRPFAGADRIDGGGGSDLIHYELDFIHGYMTGVSINLVTGSALDPSGSIDTFVGIERVRGTHFDDIIYGDDGDNEFNPLSGSDLVDGRGGNDTIQFRELFDSYSQLGIAVRGVVIDLSTGTGTDMAGDTDTLVGIENAHGSVLDDILIGDGGRNNLRGFAGNDAMTGGVGNDTIDGGDGLDTAIYTATRDRFTVSGIGTETMTISYTGAPGEDLSLPNENTDEVRGIERIQFSDGVLALDVDGAAGQAFRLYQAAFERTPDQEGLAYWIGRLDSGNTNLSAVADSFLHSPEYVRTYGNEQSISNADYIELLYTHTLSRAYDQQGYDYWLGKLDAAETNRADLLAFFSESDENKANLNNEISDGIWLPN